jgi:hypothetical protein
VTIADVPQALQVALRRNEHTGGAGDRLDDHGSDGRCIVQSDDALQLVREMSTVRRHAARERVLRQVMRVRQVIHAGEQ